jgi:hypothetical protein
MLRIMRAPMAGSLNLVALSDHLEFVWQHFVDGRTIGCTSGFGCACDDGVVPTRLYAYLGCALATDGQVVLLQLTDEGCRGLMLQDSPLCGPSLRGFIVSVRRDLTKKGKPVVSGIVTQPPYASDKIPPAPNVRAELIKIWGSVRK